MSEPASVEPRELTEAEKNIVLAGLIEMLGTIPLEDGIECVGGVLLGLLLEANEGNREQTAVTIQAVMTNMIASLIDPQSTPVPEGQVMQ